MFVGGNVELCLQMRPEDRDPARVGAPAGQEPEQVREAVPGRRRRGGEKGPKVVARQDQRRGEDRQQEERVDREAHGAEGEAKTRGEEEHDKGREAVNEKANKNVVSTYQFFSRGLIITR
jgi:hypothetical protein